MNQRSRPTLRKALAVIAAAAALCSWSTRSARAGDVVTQSRTLATFDRIVLDGAFTATIVAGSKPAFAMTGRPEDLARVTVAVAGGRLAIGMRSSSERTDAIALSIATASLRSFENGGAGRMHLSGMRGDLSLANNGAATIDVSGRASRVTIANDGIGKIDATGLDARDATVTDDGVGSIALRASGSLVMNVNGIGRIRYGGNPVHVESNVNGLGRIGRL